MFLKNAELNLNSQNIISTEQHIILRIDFGTKHYISEYCFVISYTDIKKLQ